MKNFVQTALAGLLALGLVGGSALAQSDECLSKRDIQEKTDSGELVQLSQALAASGVEGKIISSQVKVCMVDGQWQWLVNVMDDTGESRAVTLPAQ